MSKCSGCSGKGKSAMSGYGPRGGPFAKSPYSGAAASVTSLYGENKSPSPRVYAADFIGRYRTPYASRPSRRYEPQAMDKYSGPLLPFRAQLTESDTFRGIPEYRAAERYNIPFKRPPAVATEAEEEENRRKKFQVH